MLQPPPYADDIQIGETISFMVDGKMKTFEVINKGMQITIRSLDLTMKTDISHDIFRKQREILRATSEAQAFGNDCRNGKCEI